MATGLAPTATWADAGQPTYVTAALRPDGVYTLCGLDGAGQITFEVPLPARGHAAAVHPTRPEAIAFARRPGTFALVIDCSTGHQIARVTAPEGRHFYGHGAFSADGSLLYTTENDFDAARGIVGIWDARQGYRRVGEFASGGIGPHDILRLPGTETLVVANGGIETHPDSGRAKLNLPTMRPDLSYLTPDGTVLEQVELDADHRLASIRHLDVSPDGTVAFAMQWQGDPNEAPAPLGLHQRGSSPALLSADNADHLELQGYAGSVAFSNDSQLVAITSPRGGVVQVFRASDGAILRSITAVDACGLSSHSDRGFCYTSGEGHVAFWEPGGRTVALSAHPRAFDNHLIRVS
nr:DUF1513 domain-containing protein [Gymnodinialimonas ceratoperidinii]